MKTAMLLLALIPAPDLPKETRENNRFLDVAIKVDGVMAVTREAGDDGVVTHYNVEIYAWFFKNGRLTDKGHAVAEKCFRAAKLSGIQKPLRFKEHYPALPIPDEASMIQRLRKLIAEQERKKK